LQNLACVAQILNYDPTELACAKNVQVIFMFGTNLELWHWTSFLRILQESGHQVL